MIDTRAIAAVGSTVIPDQFAPDVSGIENFGQLQAAIFRQAVAATHLGGLGQLRLATPDNIENLVPPEFSILQTMRDGDLRSLIAATDRELLLVSVCEERTRCEITIAAADDEAVRRWSEFVMQAATGRHEPDSVGFRLWTRNYRTPPFEERRMGVTDNDEAIRNYPPRTQASLASLMAIEPPVTGGRLILWHGPAGTGKTSAIRMLATAWSQWCRLDVVSDPGNLFSLPSYIDEVVSGEHDDRFDFTGERRSQLVVAEDCDDELLGVEGERVSPALSRLLNLTDGIWGDGSKTLVLLTTNKPLHRVYPALHRPGRSLAVIGFDSFSEAEANQWLEPASPRVQGSRTLAELLAHSGRLQQVGTSDDLWPSGVKGGYL